VAHANEVVLGERPGGEQVRPSVTALGTRCRGAVHRNNQGHFPRTSKRPQPLRSPRNCLPRRRILETSFGLLLILMPLISYCGVANAQYHRLNCDPQGRVFVALGHTVLGIPDGAITTGGVSSFGDVSRRLAAPDETQKPGCYGNPIQAAGMDQMEQTYAFHEARWWSDKSYPTTEIRLRSLSLSRSGGMEDMYRRVHELACLYKDVIRRTDADGIELSKEKIRVLRTRRCLSNFLNRAFRPTLERTSASDARPKLI
jgi:hypothetical protein